jgi:isoamyl acetate esterase
MHNSTRIIFFGDSITELGMEPNGYVSLVKDSLRSLDSTIELIGAGISGNKVTDLQKRLKRDVLSKNPDVVVIYIGINDIWHFQLGGDHSGTAKEVYRTVLTDIVSKTQSYGAIVILCTPSVIGEKYDGSNIMDSMLDEYSDISRMIARNRKIALLDLRNVFLTYLKEHNPSNQEKDILTTDGVHLNDVGNRIVAEQMLKTLKDMKLFSK